MKTGTLRVQQRTPANVLKQNQQSTTQTKPSVVIQPRQMKDLARKISKSNRVKVLIKNPSADNSMVKSVELLWKLNRGEQQRTGKAKRLEQIKVIAVRSHGLPSFFSPFALMFYILTCSILTVPRVAIPRDRGSKTCLRDCFTSSP